MITRDEHARFEFWVFDCEEIKEWIESLLCFIVSLDETIVFDGVFHDDDITELEMR